MKKLKNMAEDITNKNKDYDVKANKEFVATQCIAEAFKKVGATVEIVKDKDRQIQGYDILYWKYKQGEAPNIKALDLKFHFIGNDMFFWETGTNYTWCKPTSGTENPMICWFVCHRNVGYIMDKNILYQIFALNKVDPISESKNQVGKTMNGHTCNTIGYRLDEVLKAYETFSGIKPKKLSVSIPQTLVVEPIMQIFMEEEV